MDKEEDKEEVKLRKKMGKESAVSKRRKAKFLCLPWPPQDAQEKRYYERPLGKGFDLLRRHFRQFLLTVVQPLPEDVTHLDETGQGGLYPGKVSGSVGERGQGLLHSLSLEVTIFASTSAMT